MSEKAVRRIGFMREDERRIEEKRMRATNHVKMCWDFADELYSILLIQTPEQAENIINFIKKALYWDEKDMW